MRHAASRLVERSVAAGAAQAEALVKTGAARAVSLGPGGGVQWTRTAEGGVALRVFMADGACGFASACGPSPTGATEDQIVSAAIDAARRPAPAPTLPADSAGDGRGLGIFDPRLHAATPADLEGLLDDAATEALRAEPRVRRLASASIAASSSEVWLANSAGFEGGYRQTLVHMSLGLMAGEGAGSVVVRRSRTARSLTGFSAALFGDETARLAATALEGRPVADGSYPALFAPAAAAEILRAFARTLAPFPQHPGAVLGSRLVTIIDDGRLPGGIASAPFDGEGTATRRTTVVARGRFVETIHDLLSAAHGGAASTGNGVRVSFRDAPRRMPTNLFISPGSDAPGDLLGELRDGVWIQSLRPAPSATRRTGDDGALVAVAVGRRVVDGRPAQPIAGALVIASLGPLMSGIVGIGNDLTFGFPVGSFGSPSLLVSEVGVRAS